MKRKTIAFYDVLLFAIICGPMIVIAVILLFMLVTKGSSEWIYKNWYLVLIFAITFVTPIAGTMMFRYYVIYNNNSIYFHYFTFAATWEQAANNIDSQWNQNVFISEIKDIEIVKLTEEEKQTKVYYKHWFNKYLKINMMYGDPKYVYVGNYSKYQIKKLIKLITNKQTYRS